MIIIKIIILLAIFLSSSALGIMLANRYKDRVLDLKQMRSALNIMKTKITYTYDPLPQIFKEISEKFNNSIRRNIQNSKHKNARTDSRRSLEIRNRHIKNKYERR